MSALHPLRIRDTGGEQIAVVIPCYQVERTIGDLLAKIGPEVGNIFCVDDASADKTAAAVLAAKRKDDRIQLISRQANGGVGAAVVDGYRAAIKAGAQVIVKIDGDGQMNPALIPEFARPVLRGEADYVKGNRFFDMTTVRSMPAMRIFGNAGLSFLTKLSTGYWDLFDPTNGYTAVQADVAAALPLDRLNRRYFFESDILFRLSTIRARVIELPHYSHYAEEESHLSVFRCLLSFPFLHLRNLMKRIIYNYFVRNFSIASVNLVAGFLLVTLGFVLGVESWMLAIQTGVASTAGTVMLSALPFLLGVQFLLSFLAHDLAMTPREAVHPRIAQVRVATPSKAANPRKRSESKVNA